MPLGWREQYQRYKEFYLNIQSLYKRRADLRAFLEISLSLTTIIIFMLFALKPTALTIISLYNQIQEKRQVTASLGQKLSDLQTADSVFGQNKNYIDDIDASIGTTAQPDAVTQQVEALGIKDSVSVINVSIGEVDIIGSSTSSKSVSENTPLPDNAKEMPIAINVSGNYQDLVAFLNDLENLRTVIKLDSVGVKSAASKNGTVIIMSISGRAPFIGQ